MVIAQSSGRSHSSRSRSPCREGRHVDRDSSGRHTDQGRPLTRVFARILSGEAVNVPFHYSEDVGELRRRIGGELAQRLNVYNRFWLLLGTRRLADADAVGALGLQSGSELTVVSRPPLTIATASVDSTVRLFDVETGENKGVFAGHRSHVRHVVFSWGGDRILTASRDGTARMFDRRLGTCITVFDGHRGSVCKAVFSPDETRIATVANDGFARLFSVDTGKCERVFEVPFDQISLCDVEFSCNGSTLTVKANDGSSCAVDVRTGGCQQMQITSHAGGVRDLGGKSQTGTGERTTSPDGTKVLTLWGTKAFLFDQETGDRLMLTGHDGLVSWGVFSPDGEYVLTASYDKTARLYNAESGEHCQTYRGHLGPVLAAAFSFD